jgi:hypothetical protein
MSWQSIVARLEVILYPELQAFEPRERGAARAEAAKEPFDLIEWGGILLGILAATALTRYAGNGLVVLERVSMTVLNFGVAFLILAVMVGPLVVRRTRRGLAKTLQQRGSSFRR